MATPTITAANAVYTLTVAGLFGPVQLQGFEADAAFATDSVDVGEFVMGVDGTFSGGLIYNAVPQTISIMPNSLSSNLFELWDATEQAPGGDKLQASATIKLLSTGRQYDLNQGYLSKVMRIPPAARTLKGRAWGLIWGSITPSPTAGV